MAAGIAATSFAVVGAAGAGAATGGTPVFSGWTANASTVTCPGKAPRVLTSMQTATFLQSWLPDSLYKHLPEQHPPATLAKCTVRVGYAVSGAAQPDLVVSYASDGHSAWIASSEGRWIVAPQSARAILAFAGRGTYEPVVQPPPSAPASSPTTAAAAARKAKSSSATPVVVVVVVVAIAVAGGALYLLRRRKTPGS